MDEIRHLVLFTFIHMSSAQPTTLHDVTLCDDVINYNRIVRDLEVITTELKSLRTSVISLETSHLELEKSLTDRSPDLKTFVDALNSNGLVKETDLQGALNGFVDRISSRFDGAEGRLQAKLSLLESTIDHFKDKASLNSQMLKFFVSQKFTALETSGKSSQIKIEKLVQNMNTTVLKNLETLSENISATFTSTSANSRHFITEKLGLKITQARGALKSIVSKTSQSLTRKVEKVTTTTLDSLVNIKDILNHHHGKRTNTFLTDRSRFVVLSPFYLRNYAKKNFPGRIHEVKII